jgi:hypothetical protein
MGTPIHTKYKANKSMRTHGTKEHNNCNTTNNTLIKWNGFSQLFFFFFFVCENLPLCPQKKKKKIERGIFCHNISFSFEKYYQILKDFFLKENISSHLEFDFGLVAFLNWFFFLLFNATFLLECLPMI